MSTPSVDPAEVIYRQVGPGGDPIYYDANRSPPLYFALFRPGSDDWDGLSLIRARFRSEIWSAFRAETPAVRYRLARVVVAAVVTIARDKGIDPLNFEPSADQLDVQNGPPWAHCVASEINRTQYDSDKDAKRRMKEWALAVANHIQAVDIIGPFGEPNEADPYRP